MEEADGTHCSHGPIPSPPPPPVSKAGKIGELWSRQWQKQWHHWNQSGVSVEQDQKKATWWWWRSLKPHLFDSFATSIVPPSWLFWPYPTATNATIYIKSPSQHCKDVPSNPYQTSSPSNLLLMGRRKGKKGTMKRSGKVGIKSDECFNSHLAPGWRLLCLIPSLTIHLELQNCFRVGERGCWQI